MRFRGPYSHFFAIETAQTYIEKRRMATNAGTLDVSAARHAYAETSVGLQVQHGEGYHKAGRSSFSLGQHHLDADKHVPLSRDEMEECARALRSSSLFRFCSDETIVKVIGAMRREEFPEGEVRNKVSRASSCQRI